MTHRAAFPLVFPTSFPETIRLVFLDLDGVLNCDTTSPNGVEPLTSQSVHVSLERIKGIDRRHVAILNRVVAETGAWIVISSSWRIMHGADETIETLFRAGFVGHVLGATPDVGPHREQDVLGFLESWDPQYRLASYAILDDGTDLGSLTPRLVLTNTDEGMTEKDADAVIRLLLEQS